MLAGINRKGRRRAYIGLAAVSAGFSLLASFTFGGFAILVGLAGTWLAIGAFLELETPKGEEE